MSENRKVLIVDDEAQVLSAVNRILRKSFEVTLANGPREALEHIQKSGPFAVVVSDQNMPEMDGIRLLSVIAGKSPATTRVMLTGDSDQKTAVKAVNDGRIFRFVAKPCGAEDLQSVIEAGMEKHQAVVAERELLQQTLSGSIKMLVDIVAVSRPLAHLRSTLIQRWSWKVSNRLVSRPPLEYSISAMLCTLGYLTLPDDLAERYFNGGGLSPEERRKVNEAASHAGEFVLNVPRMDGIADAIRYCRKGFDGTGFPDDQVRGESLPEAAKVLCPLIDLAEIISGPTPDFASAMAELERNAPRYDPRVLAAIREALADDQAFAQAEERPAIAVPVRHLEEGDVLASDIRTQNGKLLLAAGSSLSGVTIRRLQAMPSLDAPEVTLDVWRGAGQPARAAAVS